MPIKLPLVKAAVPGLVAICAMFAGCVDSSVGGGKSTENFNIAGTVRTGQAVSGSSVSSGLVALYARAQANLCASADCTTLIVGGGGVPGPSCGVEEDGAFTIDSAPTGQKLEAVFACGDVTQYCFVSSGDTGVLCDAAADNAIQAYLQATGKASLSDPAFAEKDVASDLAAVHSAINGGGESGN